MYRPLVNSILATEYLKYALIIPNIIIYFHKRSNNMQCYKSYLSRNLVEVARNLIYHTQKVSSV